MFARILALLLAACYLQPAPVFAAWTFDATPPSCTLYPPPAPPLTITIGEAISIYASAMSGDVASKTLSSDPAIAGLTFPFNWNTTGFAAGNYKFTLSLVDTSGNSSNETSCPSTTITLSSILQPWLKTTGGDVHSNTKIQAPGGP